MKFLEKLKIKKAQILCGVGAAVTTLALPIISHAADPDVTSSMTTAMSGVKTDTLSAIGAVAPIAIGIMGAFLVWKYGIRFFKAISKG